MARKSAKISVNTISIDIFCTWRTLTRFFPLKQFILPTLLHRTLLQHFSRTLSYNTLLYASPVQNSSPTRSYNLPRLLFSSPTLFRNTLPRDSFNTLYNTSPQLTIHSCSLQHFSTTLQRSSPALLYNSFQRCSTTPFSKAYYNTLLLLYDTLLHYFSTTLFANPSPKLLYNTLSNTKSVVEKSWRMVVFENKERTAKPCANGPPQNDGPHDMKGTKVTKTSQIHCACHEKHTSGAMWNARNAAPATKKTDLATWSKTHTLEMLWMVAVATTKSVNRALPPDSQLQTGTLPYASGKNCFPQDPMFTNSWPK